MSLTTVICTPQALMSHDMRALFEAAYESGFAKGYGPNASELRTFLAYAMPPQGFCLIALKRAEKYVGFALMFPPTAISPDPVLYSHYAPSNVEERKALNMAIRRQVREWNCDAFLCASHWDNDEAFIRLFRDMGQGEVVTKEIRFVLNEGVE